MSKEELLKERRAERDARLHIVMVQAFLKQWAPKDHYDRSRFEAELTGIVRQTALDVQRNMMEPLQSSMRLMLDSMTLAAHPPLFVNPSLHNKPSDETEG